MVDETGHEIPLYDEEGYPIPRRLARFDRRVPPHGVLLNLGFVHSLFAVDEDLDHIERDTRSTSDYTVYPQAGLRTAGHFQAKRLMTPCYPLLKKINTSVMDHSDDVEADDDDMEQWIDDGTPAIVGISSQGYNSVMHHTRGHSAQHHDVQIGLVTSALAGWWAKTEGTKKEALKILNQCKDQLPHERFAEKIENPNITRDLRLENVYYIDMHRMPPRHRIGRYAAFCSNLSSAIMTQSSVTSWHASSNHWARYSATPVSSIASRRPWYYSSLR